MLEKYENYLKKLDSELSKYFEEQRHYIFCKKGCSLCCSIGEYPMSRLEYNYLIEGFKTLDIKTQNFIKKRIKNLKKEYNKYRFSPNKKFEHKCPFLISNACCVYNYRALICRTFGLIKMAKTIDGYPVAILPDCVHDGLNYSNIYNTLTNQFDEAKIIENGKGTQPIPYDITLQALYEKEDSKNLDFSDRKNLIEFLLETVL